MWILISLDQSLVIETCAHLGPPPGELGLISLIVCEGRVIKTSTNMKKQCRQAAPNIIGSSILSRGYSGRSCDLPPLSAEQIV